MSRKRTIAETKKTEKFTQKDSSGNIKKVIFPNNLQVGLHDSTFPGQINATGNIQATGIITASLGFSGSLTRLIDGRSYLAAGSNVTITSASNGQVTITASGGGGGGSGDITSVVAGNGLTGGATSGAATLNIGAGTGIDVAADAISVDVSDFMTNGANNRIVTATGTDAMNAEANLDFNGTLLNVTGSLGVYANISDYAVIVDNDQSSTGHGLKVTSDGTGAGTNLFDIESASTTVFRVRGDGRVGIGKVTSLPSAILTVSSSNNDGDIAIAHKLQHVGDSDTYIEFQDDEIGITAGGRTFIKIQEDATDKLMINNGALDIDLQVKGENDANLIRTDAANDSIYFGASESAGTDNNFWVSGSITSKGTSTRGTAVIGGDLQVSGATYFSNDISLLPNKRLRFNNPGGNDQNIYGSGNALYIEGDDSIFMYTDGGFFKLFHNTEEVITKDASGNLTINEESQSFDFRVESNNLAGAILVDGGDDTVIIGGNSTTFAGQPAEAKGSDVKILLTGSVDSRDTSTRGTTLVAGDLHVSGSFNKSITTHSFYQAGTPGGNPTHEYHFEWQAGTVNSGDPEANGANDFWQYFPKGGKILDVTARGGGTNNFSSSNPWGQQLVFAMYTWGDTWINSSENTTHAGYIPTGHVTSSLPSDDVANEGGTYHHKSIWNMDYNYIKNHATGSFDITPGTSVTISFKGIGSNGISNTAFYITVEKNL